MTNKEEGPMEIKPDEVTLAFFRKYLRMPDGNIEQLCRKAEDLFEALEDMVNQFAYVGHNDTTTTFYTGGLSALEGAFDVLGWEENHPCPWRKCEREGCLKENTCGTPTPDGYKRLCGDHYSEVSHE